MSRAKTLAIVALAWMVSAVALWAQQPQTIRYTYDALDRLVSVQYADRVVSYAYDAAGNRLLLSVDLISPVPVALSLAPSSATAGSSGLSLQVLGSGFVAASVVNWNGAPRTTTYVSATQLTAAIPAADLATPGMAAVTVTSPVPGGGTSDPLSFTIVQDCSVTLGPPSLDPIPAAGGIP